MEKNKKNEDKRDQLDRFWDIESLLPRKRMPVYPVDTSTAEIVSDVSEDCAKSNVSPEKIPPRSSENTVIKRFIPPHTEEEFIKKPTPIFEYIPQNVLLHKVRVFPWKVEYRYYDGFLRDAVRLFGVHGTPCGHVPFFSYVPQYSQMNREQLAWYLWWRECVRNGQYPETDYSYVLLYIYELINLSTKRNCPEKIQGELLAIWKHYREEHQRLDGYLSEWICDFSLIHKLDLPKDFPKELFSVAMVHSTLKEFYIQTDSESGNAGILLSFCSNYDYRKSKFYLDDNRAVFDRWIPAVVNKIAETTQNEEGKLFSAARMDDSRMMRDAYSGALCLGEVKRKIEVEYCSFSRSHELRFLITDIVKYTENRLRAYLGIRSRLTIYALPNPIREQIDAFFALNLPPSETKSAAGKKAPVPPEPYEKLYDLPKTPLSLSAAKEIEKQSWTTTERLIEAFGGANTPPETDGEENGNVCQPSLREGSAQKETPMAGQPMPDGTDGQEADTLTARLQAYLPYLWAIKRGDYRQIRQLTSESGKLFEVIVEEINEISADFMGDILIEEIDGTYGIIEDYKDELTFPAEMDAEREEGD